MESAADRPFIDACTGGERIILSWYFGDIRDAGRSVAGIDVPFPFQVWGSDVSVLWPSIDGAIELDSGSVLIAPFWDDLYLDSSPGSDVCYRLVGTAPNRQLVVEWLHAHRWSRRSVDLTFEVILHEATGAVELVYRDLTADAADAAYADGSMATIEVASVRRERAARYESVLHAIATGATQSLVFTPLQ